MVTIHAGHTIMDTDVRTNPNLTVRNLSALLKLRKGTQLWSGNIRIVS